MGIYPKTHHIPGHPRTDRPLCHNCLAPNDATDHFCHRCGVPLTCHAAIDPLGRIHAMGDTFRRALDRSGSNRFIRWAMFLIFGPNALCILAVLLGPMIPALRYALNWLSLPIVITLACVYLGVIWRLCFPSSRTVSPPPEPAEHTDPTESHAWTCPQCQMDIEDQFAQCWHCRCNRPEE